MEELEAQVSAAIAAAAEDAPDAPEDPNLYDVRATLHA